MGVSPYNTGKKGTFFTNIGIEMDILIRIYGNIGDTLRKDAFLTDKYVRFSFTKKISIQNMLQDSVTV